MLVYTNTKYKPKKKRKLRGVIAQKLNVSSLHKEKTVSSISPRFYDDQTKKIQSLGISSKGNTIKKESIKYTGTLVKGIAVTHKSNLIPITSKEQAEEVAKMRRG
jgi:hypothetical protein